MVYAILVEQLERTVLAERVVEATFMAAGAKNRELPVLHEKRILFDAALVEEPKPVKQLDRDQLALRRALGVK